MANCQTVTLCREIIDAQTVVSKIKTGGVIVHVKSIFNGKKDISDIIFDVAKNDRKLMKQCIN